MDKMYIKVKEVLTELSDLETSVNELRLKTENDEVRNALDKASTMISELYDKIKTR